MDIFKAISLATVGLAMVSGASTCKDYACPEGMVVMYWKASQGNPTEKDCCTNTCAKFNCPADKSLVHDPEKMSYFSARSLDEAACCTSTCKVHKCQEGYDNNPDKLDSTTVSDAECCLPKCDIFSCQNGWKKKEPMLQKIGASDSDCCEKTCAALVCDHGTSPIPDKLTSTTDVTQEGCCDKTCEAHKCGPTWVFNSDKSLHMPDRKSWTKAETMVEIECCLQTCADFKECPEGHVLKPQNMNSTQVDEANCCQKTCAAHKCPAGYSSNPATSAHFGISDNNCCHMTCELFNCKAGFRVNPENNHVTDLTNEACCTVSCDGYQAECPANHVVSHEAGKEGEIKVSQEECCVKTCAATSCNTGYSPNPKQTKSTNIAHENCCLQSCAAYLCPAGHIVNVNTASSTVLSTAHCCVPTCELYSCPTGWRLDQANLKSTVLDDTKCCRKTCATVKCQIGTGLNPDKVNALRPDDEAKAFDECCIVTTVDVTESIFCDKATGLLLESVKVKVGGVEEERKCCCERDTEKCKVGIAKNKDMVKSGDKKILGCGVLQQGEGFLAHHNFFEKGEEKTEPPCKPKRKCVLPWLVADELQQSLVK